MGAREMLRACAACVAVLLAGCATADEKDVASKPIEAVFLCGDDIARTQFEADKMTLTLGPARYVLYRAPSGSGARYTGKSASGPVEFWNKGREARLTIGGQTLPTCQQHGYTR